MLKVHIFPFQTEQLAPAVAVVNSLLKEHSELNGDVLAVEQFKDMSGDIITLLNKENVVSDTYDFKKEKE